MCANHSHLTDLCSLVHGFLFLWASDENEIVSLLNEGRMGVIQLSCACYVHGYAYEDCIKQMLSFLIVFYIRELVFSVVVQFLHGNREGARMIQANPL